MAAIVISATEFKAKCLAILDDVQRRGSTVTVTKRGLPVATVGPVQLRSFKSLKGCLAVKGAIPQNVLMKNREDMARVLNKRLKKLSNEFPA